MVVQANPNSQEIRTPMVEILFVIDDSGSMGTHQENLKKNTAQFVGALEQSVILDYRIGITTTSKKNTGMLLGPRQSYITPRTPNALQVLADAMIVGSNGDGTEILLSQIIPVLDNPQLNFARPKSHFAVVFVTDAEDQSKLEPRIVYEDLVRRIGGDPERVLAYGAIIPPGVDDCSRDGGVSDTPDALIQFMQLVYGGDAEGKYFNLCSPNFGLELAGIAEDIVEKVGNLIRLDKVPDPRTIQVKYGEVNIPNHPDKGWTYDPKEKSIYLGREIEWPNDEIERDLTIGFERAIFPEEREHAKK